MIAALQDPSFDFKKLKDEKERSKSPVDTLEIESGVIIHRISVFLAINFFCTNMGYILPYPMGKFNLKLTVSGAASCSWESDAIYCNSKELGKKDKAFFASKVISTSPVDEEKGGGYIFKLY